MEQPSKKPVRRVGQSHHHALTRYSRLFRLLLISRATAPVSRSHLAPPARWRHRGSRCHLARSASLPRPLPAGGRHLSLAISLAGRQGQDSWPHPSPQLSPVGRWPTTAPRLGAVLAPTGAPRRNSELWFCEGISSLFKSSRIQVISANFDFNN
jgi:hypothetical protein